MPASTILPAYITASLSHMRATMPRLWVTKMIATPVCSLQFLQQVEVLRLDRHVEVGGRLVGDDQLRAAGERDRADDALAHAARHLVRILAHALAGEGMRTASQQFARPARAACGRAAPRW